jgi:hypothetical protein
VAVGAAIMAMWYGIRRGYRAVRAVERILEAVESNQLHVQTALKELSEIRKEVKPNGGSSLKDAVNRIDRRVAVLESLDLQHHRRNLESTPDNS